MTVSGSVESLHTTFFQKENVSPESFMRFADVCCFIFNYVGEKFFTERHSGEISNQEFSNPDSFSLIVVSELLIQTSPSRASCNHPVIILSSPFFSTDDHFDSCNGMSVIPLL